MLADCEVKTLLAILAHEGAADTVADFMPRWRRLGIPVWGFVPDGHALGGFDRLICHGANGRVGASVFGRFLHCCDALLTDSDADVFIIAEYDTVNILDNLTPYKRGVVTCPGVVIPAEGRKTAKCLLSPWTMDCQTLGRLCAAMRSVLAETNEWNGTDGLLDRWLGFVCAQHSIPCLNACNALGYPWHDGVHERIRRLNYAWVHGWKRKEDFGELWPRD